MSEYYYYGMAAVLLLTTCWMFVAARWFHTCPMTNCQGGLLTKHLPEHVLQRFSLIGSKRRDSVLQTPFVDGAYLVGGHLAVTTYDMTTHAVGIAMNGRRDGNDNHRVEMSVQFLGTDDDARPNLLHLCADGGV